MGDDANIDIIFLTERPLHFRLYAAPSAVLYVLPLYCLFQEGDVLGPVLLILASAGMCYAAQQSTV
jgi:hypothetical protein